VVVRWEGGGGERGRGGRVQLQSETLIMGAEDMQWPSNPADTCGH